MKNHLENASRVTQFIETGNGYLIYLIIFIFTCMFHVNTLDAADPQVVRVAPDVYAFIGSAGGANSGFIVTKEGVAVIDAQGPKDLALLLREGIEKITKRPLIYLINTHFHGDHTFGNQHFKETKSIIAHRNTRDALIEHEKGQMKVFAKIFGEERAKGIVLTPPNVSFERNMTLFAGGVKVELIYLGKGHTGGDIVVYLPEKKVLFSGDLLYNKRLPWVGDGDTFEWIKVLDRLASLKIDTIVPGHGLIGGKELLSDFKGYIKDLQKEVMRYRDDGHSLDELMKAIDLPEYKEYLKYEEWLPLNAKKVYMELETEKE